MGFCTSLTAVGTAKKVSGVLKVSNPGPGLSTSGNSAFKTRLLQQRNAAISSIT